MKQVMSAFGLERVTVLKVVLLAGAALLAGCMLVLVGTSKPAGAAFPGTNGKISYSVMYENSFPLGSNWAIYSMNPDGSNQTNLTNTTDGNYDFSPAWSPDGTKIAFISRQNVNDDIFVMNADGTDQTRIANLGFESAPDWSPDGTKIAFSSSQNSSNEDIYTMNADGSNQIRLTTDPAFDTSPAWSPDSTKLAFSTDRNNGHYEIYSMDSDGSNQTRLTDTPQPEFGSVNLQEPSWQPIFAFSGFYQPVDNLPTLNKTKAGKTIPIRFRLGGDKGLDIFATGYPRSEAINCETGARTDDIEQTVLGKSGLTYDPVSDRYTYNWATSSSWSGCRQFVMTLKDGTTHRANFTFK